MKRALTPAFLVALAACQINTTTIGEACDPGSSLGCPCEAPSDCGTLACVDGTCLGYDQAQCAAEGGASCFILPTEPADGLSETCEAPSLNDQDVVVELMVDDPVHYLVRDTDGQVAAMGDAIGSATTFTIPAGRVTPNFDMELDFVTGMDVRKHNHHDLSSGQTGFNIIRDWKTRADLDSEATTYLGTASTPGTGIAYLHTMSCDLAGASGFPVYQGVVQTVSRSPGVHDWVPGAKSYDQDFFQGTVVFDLPAGQPLYAQAWGYRDLVDLGNNHLSLLAEHRFVPTADVIDEIILAPPTR